MFFSLKFNIFLASSFCDAKFYRRKQKLENSHQLKLLLILSPVATCIVRQNTALLGCVVSLISEH